MVAMDAVVTHEEARALVRPLLVLALGVGASVGIWHLLMAEPWRPRGETVRVERLNQGDRQALQRVLHGTPRGE
jgi:hypothetical protein